MFSGQGAAGGMRGRLGAYREMRDNMSEGLRFYMSLQEAIATLHQQAGDYVLTRRLQRWAYPSTQALTDSITDIWLSYSFRHSNKDRICPYIHES